MNGATIAMAGLGAALALALVTDVAFAAPAPAECPNTPAAKRIVENARNQRARFLEHLFDTQYGCLALEQFAEKANQFADEATHPDPCVLKGIREATSATIDKVSQRCFGSVTERLGEARLAAGECTNSGAQAGYLAATAFCTIPDGGPGTTPSICMLLSAFSCRNEFNKYTRDHCPQKKADYPDMYKEAIEAACNP